MLINVTRSSMPSYEEYCEEIKDIWESRWLTNNGAKHQQFEAQLKDFLGVGNVALFTNGHLALENAIAAMDLPKGGEVITTPFTFASTTHAISRNGLVPVFCDINPVDYTIDAGRIEALIMDKTCAIVPVHVYGNICAVEKIEAVAKKHGLKVIYDAAHAFGAKYKGVSSACFGDASMFSFHATKVFHTIEGGTVCYADASLCDKFNAQKNFGQVTSEFVPAVGGNAKMNEFQAAMGICNLRHISEEIEKRKNAVTHYRERLSNVEGLRLNVTQADTESNYAYFPVVFEEAFGADRDEVIAALAQNEIIARKYFYPLTNDFDCYKELNHGDTPVAEYISSRVLCLPLYADLTAENIDKICDAVLNCKR